MNSKRCGGSEGVTLQKKSSLEKDTVLRGSPSPFNAGRKPCFGAMIEGAREKNRRRIFVKRDDEEQEETKLETMFESNGCGMN